jgi:hypothetical protein
MSTDSQKTDSQKIAEMQHTIHHLSTTVNALVQEVARLSFASQTGPVMKTSIPLMPTQPAQVYGNRAMKYPQQKGRRPYGELRQSADMSADSKPLHVPVPLSTLLKTDEEVTFFVYVEDKQISPRPIRTTAEATFDGTHLIVKDCDLVPSLKGTKTQKPGEILYKFIEELKNGGHIKRTFSVAPWKLCFVTRDGEEVTLDQLRANLGQ